MMSNLLDIIESYIDGNVKLVKNLTNKTQVFKDGDEDFGHQTAKIALESMSPGILLPYYIAI